MGPWHLQAMDPSNFRLIRVYRLLSALSASKKNDHAALQCVAELLLELLGEFVVVEALVLCARVLDLQRAHQVADAADGEPLVVLLDAEDPDGAELGRAWCWKSARQSE